MNGTFPKKDFSFEVRGFPLTIPILDSVASTNITVASDPLTNGVVVKASNLDIPILGSYIQSIDSHVILKNKHIDISRLNVYLDNGQDLEFTGGVFDQVFYFFSKATRSRKTKGWTGLLY